MSPWISPETLNSISTSWLAVLGDVWLRGLALLLLALLLDRLLRHQAAASRHLLWSATSIALLLLPLFLLLPGVQMRGLPDWSAQIQGSLARTPSAELAVAGPAGESAASPVILHPATSSRMDRPRPVWVLREAAVHAAGEAEPSGFVAALVQTPWTVWALLVWELGALLVLGVHGVGLLRLRALERHSRPFDDPAWQGLLVALHAELGLRRLVCLLQSHGLNAPMTWGVWRPVVLLPATASEWSMEKRRNVLLHELEHVRRGDVLSQSLAQLACVLLWMHPLAWIAAGRMRLERERACDDRVLLAGSRASTYAGHLLEMARSLQSSSAVELTTVGMARRAQLGERVQSLLDPRGRPLILGARGRILALFLAAPLIAPLAILKAAPAEEPAAPASAPTAGPGAMADPPTTPNVEESSMPRAPAPPPVPALPMARLDGDEDQRWSWTFSDDEGQRLRVEIDGRMRLNEAGDDVEWMGLGARLEVEQERAGERRRMVLEGRKDGEIERRYWLGRRQREIDEEAQRWFGETLRRFSANAGIDAPDRVRRQYEQGGLEAVLRGIDELESDHARTIHLGALLQMDALSADERARALRTVDRTVDSDFAKAQILALVLDRERLDKQEAAEIFLLVDGMDSDFERARVLLAMPIERMPGVEIQQSFARTVGRLHSDFEKSRVLAHAFQASELNKQTTLELLDAIHDVNSDFEKARALAAAAPHCAGDPELEEAYLRVADEIDSEFEYGRAVRQLRRHAD